MTCSQVVDLPPLTAASAFSAVAPHDGAAIHVDGGAPVVDAASAALLAEVADGMYAWVEDWIDAACADLFVHPALRRRPDPPRP